MQIRTKFLPGAAWSLALSLFAASGLAAQARVLLPEGSVIIVRTATALQSNNLQVGQSFSTVVVDTVSADEYTVIPAGSRIRGVISFVQPATRQQSGVIEVAFDRLTLPDGTTYPIDGRLTSTDATERRQIDADPNARVVLVGGRGGIGGAIMGAGSENSPASGILSALGSILSSGQNVNVPAGTRLAVQLDQPVTLRARGGRRIADAYTVFTAEDRIRAAQQALAQQNYYRGTVNGQLDDATRRALFEYQVDKGLTATGNLDWRTARSLGLTTGGAVGAGSVGSSFGAVLTVESATTLRRNAQNLVGRQRLDLSVSGTATVNARRAYTAGDVDLWFALSAFADNASLYEQLVRGGGNADAAAVAGRSLITAARRVDDAMQQARPSSTVQSSWAIIRRQLSTIEPSYANSF
ncbi:MAG TPA: peptidoglycan-binding protein [Gemmatimonadaceae bacterium]|nr:peptidoglycan-binding protein [Gemmatimonadaceae bacterium]